MRRAILTARAVAAAVTLTVPAASNASAAGAAPVATETMRVGLPAYWSPATPHGAEEFRRLAEATPTLDIVIINGPVSAAPVPFDQATAQTIRDLRRAGVTVLGYVDSGYLGTAGLPTTRVNPGSTATADWVAQIRGDIANWYDLYGWYGWWR